MSKHSLPPTILSPPKRFLIDINKPKKNVLTTFDSSLYDELILFIFSFLDCRDLCVIQRTNSNWARLSSDNQLWKALYIREYGRLRLRGGRGFIGRPDGRDVRPLPGRARSVDDRKDWKWMFRITTNWSTGRCSVESLAQDIGRSHMTGRSAGLSGRPREQTHILLAGNLTITASARISRSPSVTLRSPSGQAKTLVCRSTYVDTSAGITTLALNQSPPLLSQDPSTRSLQSNHIRLAVFLSTGEFSIFELNQCAPSLSPSSAKLAYVPARSYQAADDSHTAPIIHAAYHHPVLVTLSQSFRLSIYDLNNNDIAHMQTLSSFTSHPPTSLVLSAMAVPATYKLVLAYAVPVYPAHWSVGATELIISRSSTSTVSSPFDDAPDSSTFTGPLTVTGTRTVRAFDVPSGWIDEQKLRAMREQWGRKVKRVADTQTDGKWLVLAPGDELSAMSALSSAVDAAASPASLLSPVSSDITILPARYSAAHLQLYRLQLPSFNAGLSSNPKLTFVRTLYGPIGPVCALALADGRCVSLGTTGDIWVWDLEAGDSSGAEIAAPVASSDEIHTWEDSEEFIGKGSIAFDERTIVSAGVRGVELRRFDI